LQEPLRMVASYTQLLSRRYKGKLDADADDFIAFAVDGATRMQRLIQDLLAYSRVGTKGKNLHDTSSEDALQQAVVNLRGAIKESGALVTHDPLPIVLADRPTDSVISKPCRQCHQIPTPWNSPRARFRRQAGPEEMDIFGEGQRIGNRLAVLRKDFRDVPAAAQTGGVRWHRHRTCHLQEDRRAARRDHLGRVTTRAGVHFSLSLGGK
jgi:signal transduction histidine kinase